MVRFSLLTGTIDRSTANLEAFAMTEAWWCWLGKLLTNTKNLMRKAITGFGGLSDD
jgi:hypothetical protein